MAFAPKPDFQPVPAGASQAAAATSRHSLAADYSQTQSSGTSGAEHERLESIQSWTAARPPPPALPSRQNSSFPIKSAAPAQPNDAIFSPPHLQPPGPMATGAGGTPYQRDGYGAGQALNGGFGAGRKGDIYGGPIGGAVGGERKASKDSLSFKWAKRASSFLSDL